VTTDRARVVTPLDIELLDAVARTGTVVGAARTVGIGRETAAYRLRRLANAAGGDVLDARRTGAGRGSRLTDLGWRILRAGPGREAGPASAAPGPTPIRGVYRALPHPTVETDAGPRLAVAFRARTGSPVDVVVDPEAILLARERFSTSARNVLDVRVVGLRPERTTGGELRRVELDDHGLRLTALVTQRAARELHLVRGAQVVAYVKATAIRLIAPSRVPRATHRARR